MSGFLRWLMITVVVGMITSEVIRGCQEESMTSTSEPIPAPITTSVPEQGSSSNLEATPAMSLFEPVDLVSALALMRDSQARQLNLPFVGDLSKFPLFNFGNRQIEVPTEPVNKNYREDMKSLFEMFIPRINLPLIGRTTTTTTTTTTRSPVLDLTKTFLNMTGNSNRPQIIEGPAKMLNTMLQNSMSLTHAGGKTPMERVTEATGKVVGSISGLAPHAHTTSDQTHMEPKYLSKECNFRVACEVGKAIKIIPRQFHKTIERSKIIQDLHNNYTRAWTYGMIHDSCERYYCFFVKLLGGPRSFAASISEMVGMIANPGGHVDLPL